MALQQAFGSHLTGAPSVPPLCPASGLTALCLRRYVSAIAIKLEVIYAGSRMTYLRLYFAHSKGEGHAYFN